MAAVDHVAVGDGVAVRRDKESRTHAASLIVAGRDGDHRRPDVLGHIDDRLRIGVEQIGVGAASAGDETFVVGGF